MDELIIAGIVEYIDKQKEELRVAPSPLHTPDGSWESVRTAEIEASMLMGLCGGCIPFRVQSVAAKLLPVRHGEAGPRRVRPELAIRMDTVSDAPGAAAAHRHHAPGRDHRRFRRAVRRQHRGRDPRLHRAESGGLRHPQRGRRAEGLFRSVKMQLYRDEERQNGGSDSERIEFDKETAPTSSARATPTTGCSGRTASPRSAPSSLLATSSSRRRSRRPSSASARKSIKRTSRPCTVAGRGRSTPCCVVQNDGTRQVRVRVRITRPRLATSSVREWGKKVWSA